MYSPYPLEDHAYPCVNRYLICHTLQKQRQNVELFEWYLMIINDMSCSLFVSFQPLAHYAQLTPANIIKMPESAWRATFYIISWTFIAYVIVGSHFELFTDPPSVFKSKWEWGARCIQGRGWHSHWKLVQVCATLKTPLFRAIFHSRDPPHHF